MASSIVFITIGSKVVLSVMDYSFHVECFSELEAQIPE